MFAADGGHLIRDQMLVVTIISLDLQFRKTNMDTHQKLVVWVDVSPFPVGGIFR